MSNDNPSTNTPAGADERKEVVIGGADFDPNTLPETDGESDAGQSRESIDDDGDDAGDDTGVADGTKAQPQVGDEEDPDGDDSHPLKGADFAAIMEAFTGKPKEASADQASDEDDEPVAPKAKSPAKSYLDPDEDLEDGDDGDIDDAEIARIAEEIDPTLAKAFKSLTAKVAKLTAEREVETKGKQEQQRAQFEKQVHGHFDKRAEDRGVVNLYGNYTKGLSTEQRAMRVMVHDLAVTMFKKLGNQKIAGKAFTEEAAIDAAERAILEHTGAAAKRNKVVDSARLRHASRSAVGIASGVARDASDEDDPDVADGTKAPSRKR
jgi:hypothetical protein